MTLGEVKRFLNKTVLYDGDLYVMRACVLFLDNIYGEFCYSAEIVSIKTNTVMRVPLEKIKEI